MGLGQRGCLQELVSRCPRMLICSQLDHSGWGYIPCQTLTRKSDCSWVYLCLYSTCNIHRDPCLSAGECDGYHSLPKKEVHSFDKSDQKSSWNRRVISSWLPGARSADKPRELWTTILYSTKTHHCWANRWSTEKTNTRSCVYLWFH